MKIKHAESKEFSLRKGKNKKISNKKSPARKLMNFFIFIFTAAVLGYGLVTFFFQTVTMLGPSMEPAVSDGDVLIINKMVYVFSDVKRYDTCTYIILFFFLHSKSISFLYTFPTLIS